MEKESGTEIGNSLEFDFCPTLFSYACGGSQESSNWSNWASRRS